MIRTLHRYLTRDLLRATFLALVAFTLVMTVFAIIEPLRKEGLSGGQVLRLFAYTLPVMFSFTLPIAALFASTIVYGRFAQDQELMACRASGIGTFSLLKPALVLGLVVMVCTVALTNFVTPHMARMGEAAVRRNIQGILFHQIRSDGYFRHRGFFIHADEIDEDHVPPVMHGVVAMDTRARDNVRVIAASHAFVDFAEHPGEQGTQTYVSITLVNPAELRTGRPDVHQMRTLRLESPPLRELLRERPRFYDWRDLQRIKNDPSRHPDVQDALGGVIRQIRRQAALGEAFEAIQTGGSYDALVRDDERYILQSPRSWADRGTIHMVARPGEPQRPQVTVLRNERPVQVVEADAMTLDVVSDEIDWIGYSGPPQVTIQATGNVTIRSLDGPGDQLRRNDWRVGGIPLPQDGNTPDAHLDLSRLLADPQSQTANPGLIRRVMDVRELVVNRILLDTLAEMHARIAYGASCFLLVAMGAALGTHFRGGQMISAFAICVAPATLTMVMILMGKQMVSNPGVDVTYGLAAVWSGVALLGLANAVLYGHLVRR